jgi:hypothetical protein
MNFITYILFSFLTVSVAAQDTIPVYPKTDFRSPLDIPFLLAGNFGEPRRSHFHTGLDMRTQEREGLNVYAVADGYVSRIGVSPGGYGNVLYVTHPNGFTSVYGHLKQFNERITAVIRKEQYDRKSFSVDLLMKPDMLPVKKGEIIALSGNTGGSGGPHLHFEIRDAMERPINPLLFGYQIPDHIAPTIGALKLYAKDETRFTTEGYRMAVKSTMPHEYTTAIPLVMANAKVIGISVNAFDKMDNGMHTLGIYDIKMYDGDSMLHHYHVDRIAFDYVRNVIAEVDYPIFLKEGSRSFHKCYLEPNNKLPASYESFNGGLINIADGKVHNIRIEVRDLAGNVSMLHTQVQYEAQAPTFKAKNVPYVKVLDPAVENKFYNSEFSMVIPGRALQDSMLVNYTSTAPKSPGVFSAVHKFGESYEHLLAYAEVSVKPIGLPEAIKDKALIIWRSEAGGTAAKGGKWNNDMLTAKTRELGTYYVAIDTTAPRIVPVNIVKGKKGIPTLKNIVVRISDNLSGIDTYDAYVDDVWQLMEFDAKSAMLRMALPKTLSSGEHIFKLVVKDERKNESTFTANFNY